ncbi:hypothetical protein PENTCL1PPCAC_14602, partial [Pristionchus entomophagus]
VALPGLTFLVYLMRDVPIIWGLASLSLLPVLDAVPKKAHSIWNSWEATTSASLCHLYSS